SVDRDISDTYFNKMCQRIKAMNYSGLYIFYGFSPYLGSLFLDSASIFWLILLFEGISKEKNSSF
ncbi:hypothetical protein P6Z32_08295, partial [Enterococcus faecium]|uniref:hypothetical protein n=1 Tax=Enterococcus faecium TaxID=1352 RepID=UPI002890A28E